MKRSQLVRDIIETVVLTLVIFFAIRFVIQTYSVDGPSMEPGLSTSEFLIVNKAAYFFGKPQRGDIIVFHYPLQPSSDFIKRVIGVPGDTIRTDSTRVWVNDQLLDEHEYISAPSNAVANVWTVPDNQYFVMGDNRGISNDSRSFGFVPRDYIVGKAAVVFWPLNKWKTLDTHYNVFANVPNK